MSNTQTHENKQMSVTRNEATATLEELVFGKKSADRAGLKFYAPQFTVNNLVELGIPFMGIDEVVTAVNKILRRYGADIMIDMLDTDEYKQTGQISREYLISEWQNFTAGIQKLSDIEEQLDELQALQQSYVLDEAFGETDQSGNKTERAQELETLAREVALKIKPLRTKKKEIETKYAERAAKRKFKEDFEAVKTAIKA